MRMAGNLYSEGLPMLALILLATLCVSRIAPVGDPQGLVDRVASITPASTLANLEKCNRADFKFDVNQCFAVLDHLSMEPGYTLDYRMV